MRRIGTAYAVGLALLVGGCGGGSSGPSAQSRPGFEDLSGDDVLAASAADMGKVTSVRITGVTTVHGARLWVDSHVGSDGHCRAHLRLGGGKAAALQSGGRMWIQADAAYLRAVHTPQPARTAATIGSKWVEVGPASLADECDLATFKDNFDDPPGRASWSPRARGAGTVDGQRAVHLSGRDHGVDFDEWVSVAAPHYVLRLVTGGDAPSRLDFSEYGRTVRAEPPPASRIFHPPAG